MKSKITTLGLGPVMVALVSCLGFLATAADVQQYRILKGQTFLQVDAGAATPNGPTPVVLQCQADASGPGVLTNMTFTPPGGSVQSVPPDGDQHYSFEQAFASQSALDTQFANGNYSLTLKAVNDGTHTVSLSLTGNGYPNTPHISNFSAAQAVDPTVDFTLTWDALNGSANDFLMVTVRDGNNNDVARSPDFGQPGALNGQSTSMTISARTLRPSQTYQAELLIAHAPQQPDGASYPGATGIAAYFKKLNFTLVTQGTQTGNAVGQFTLVFNFYQGTFNGTVGTISFPQPLGYYFALYNVSNDTNYPASVTFNGPGGSGLTNVPSLVNGSGFGSSAFYSSPQVNFSPNNLPPGAFYSPTPPPGGVYRVNYKGTNQAFNLLDPQSANQQILVVPTIALTSSNTIQEIRWTYKTTNGNTVGPQQFMGAIQIRVNGTTGGRLYDGGLDNNFIQPTTTNHTPTAVIAWTNVSSIQMVFIDTVGNQYVSYWDQAPQPLQITTANLPNATQGTPYSFLLSSQGGRQPVSWMIDSGYLPSGLSLNFNTGEILGTPGENGSFPLVFRATDQQNATTNRALTLTVNSGSFPAPAFTNALVNGQRQLTVQVLGVTNQFYTIEATTNFVNWFVRKTLFVTNGTSVPILDPDALSRFPRLFYRLRVGRVFNPTFTLHFFANGGSFGGGLTPIPSFPVTLNSYLAHLEVENTRVAVPATNVFFTDPNGSNLSGTMAFAQNSTVDADGATYQSPTINGVVNPPPGTWTVRYAGTNLTFNRPDALAPSRLVIPLPTVTVSNGNLTSISWVYKDAATGTTLNQPPAFVTNMEIEVDTVNGQAADLPDLPPNSNNGVSLFAPVVWNNVTALHMVYDDTLGNTYIVSYQNP